MEYLSLNSESTISEGRECFIIFQQGTIGRGWVSHNQGCRGYLWF